jgi:hypothetical protein
MKCRAACANEFATKLAWEEIFPRIALIGTDKLRSIRAYSRYQRKSIH